jgi:hypothetical protein
MVSGRMETLMGGSYGTELTRLRITDAGRQLLKETSALLWSTG